MNDDRARLIVTLVIVAGFLAALGWLLVQGVPERGGEALLVALGALGGGFSAAVQYWLGSSAGSSAKNGALERMADLKREGGR